jgi:branched-chain amino acid transport system substrate-binding protein
MRKPIAFAVALVAAGSIAAIATSGAGATARRAHAAKTCSATIAIEAPITGDASFIGSLQLRFAQEAVANYNKSLHLHVTLAQDDTQLSAPIAVQKAQSIISSNAVGVVGPAGSQEVEAVGPLFGRAGITLVSPSATLPALANHSKNATFFRVVPNDDIQGPQDANYIVHKLHPKGVLIIDDGEAYSQGLVNVMTPILKSAGIKVTHKSFLGTDTGATLAGVLKAFVTADLSKADTVTVIPWQVASEAQQLGLDIRQQGKHTTLFGTDGDWAPGSGGFEIDGSYVSSFAPNIADINKPLDKQVVAGVGKYGAFGPFGVPAYEAAHVLMRAIANVCAKGGTPSRSNVLAQVKKTYIAPGNDVLGVPISFTSGGNLVGHYGYLYHINNHGTYVEINPKTGAAL